MKVVILAGGLPSTIMEENGKIPKPMAEIGRRPILWHIMKQYAHYGFKDFIICTGYKGNLIKNYFMNFYIYQSDITVDLRTNYVKILRRQTEDWNVLVIDTGLDSSVAERILAVKEYLREDSFLVTYGDCLSDINIANMASQHKYSGGLATYAVTYPTGRNKILPVDEKGNIAVSLRNGLSGTPWVNACSMVFEPDIFQYLKEAGELLDEKIMWQLSTQKKVSIYCHNGFWSPVETIRDKTMLENMWRSGKAPWKVWRG